MSDRNGVLMVKRIGPFYFYDDDGNEETSEELKKLDEALEGFAAAGWETVKVLPVNLQLSKGDRAMVFFIVTFGKRIRLRLPASKKYPT